MEIDWISTTIGEQVTLQRGIDITRAEQRPGSVPVVSSGGVSSYHDTPAASGPGVVLGRKGVVGSVYFVASDYWPHDTTLWAKDFHGNYPRFVYYFFLWMAPHLARMDVGSANPTLNRNHVHPIAVLWPPLSQQRTIADILGTLDDKIQSNQQINRVLEAMARAIFKSWFVDFDPVVAKSKGRAPLGMDIETASLFPNAFQDSPIGAIPKGWSVGSILDHAELLSGGTPKTSIPEYWGGDLPWVSAADVSNCGEAFLIESGRYITERGLHESSTRMIPVKATAIVARGATTGRLCLFGREMAMNQTCYALKSKRELPFFLYCLSRASIENIVHMAYGSVFDTITTRTFHDSRVIIPASEVMVRFEQVVISTFEAILSHLLQSAILKKTRDALLPRLLSGKIKVRGAGAVDDGR